MNNSWKRVIAIGCVICGLGVSSLVLADMMYEPSGYIGAAAGRIDVNDSDFEDDDMSGKIYLGGKFGPYLGVEASANDFGDSSTSVSEWELDGATLALVGFLPLNERFGFFAKIGNLWWDADARFMGVGDDFDGSERFGGVGAQFNFNDNFSLRLEYERYKVEIDEDELNVGPGVDIDVDSRVNVASAGLQFNF